MVPVQEHIKETHLSVLVCVDSRPRFSLTPCVFESCILLHPTVMLVVWPMRRPKPRFCEVLVSSSSFGAHLGVCMNRRGSLNPLCKQHQGCKCVTRKMQLTPHSFGEYLIRALQKPHIQMGNRGEKNKPTSRRTSKLVTVSAHFSRCVYLGEHLCSILWCQDAIWRREIWFNWVIERSNQARSTL